VLHAIIKVSGNLNLFEKFEVTFKGPGVENLYNFVSK
jgi:hypothetical protein